MCCWGMPLAGLTAWVPHRQTPPPAAPASKKQRAVHHVGCRGGGDVIVATRGSTVSNQFPLPAQQGNDAILLPAASQPYKLPVPPPLRHPPGNPLPAAASAAAHGGRMPGQTRPAPRGARCRPPPPAAAPAPRPRRRRRRRARRAPPPRGGCRPARRAARGAGRRARACASPG